MLHFELIHSAVDVLIPLREKTKTTSKARANIHPTTRILVFSPMMRLRWSLSLGDHSVRRSCGTSDFGRGHRAGRRWVALGQLPPRADVERHPCEVNLIFVAGDLPCLVTGLWTVVTQESTAESLTK